MPGAGEYGDRLRWLKRSVTKNPANGQDVEAFEPNGYLWGSIDLTTGRKSKDIGANQTGADATIRVRNWPSVSALDRLYAVEWDELWVLEHVRRGDNELVIEANKYDDLELEDQ